MEQIEAQALFSTWNQLHVRAVNAVLLHGDTGAAHGLLREAKEIEAELLKQGFNLRRMIASKL